MTHTDRPQATSHPATSHPVWPALVLCTVGVTVFMIEPLMLGALARTHALSHAQIGMLAAAEMAGMSLAALACAFWLPRLTCLPWRPLAAASLVVAAVGATLTAQVTGFTALVMLRLVTSMGGLGIVYALGMVLVGQSGHPARNFAWVVSCQAAYSVVALSSAPHLIDLGGLPGLVWPLAALALLALLAVPSLPPGLSHRQKAAVLKRPAPALAAPAGVVGLFILMVWFAGMCGLWAFVDVIGTAAGHDPMRVGAALAVAASASLAGSVGASWLDQRCGLRRPFAAAVLLQVCTVALFIQPGQWLVFLIAATGLGLTWNFAQPFLLASIAEGDSSGSLPALIPAAQGLGALLGPLAAGALGDRHGASAAVWLAMFTGLLAVLAHSAWRSPRRRWATDRAE